VAQSRRRERELARRRFERRRLAEMERRAQQRRRNNIIGAVVGVVVVLGAIVGISIYAFGHGSSKKPIATGSTPTPSSSLGTSTAPTTSPSTSTSTSSSTSASKTIAAATKTCTTISPNPPASGEPHVPDYSGTVGSSLVKRDVTVGKGAVAKSGDSVTVKYIGVGCSSGKVFDASYTDGASNQEFTFSLGKGQVIKGWDQGVAGMKVGGVRELVIPPALAYRAKGQLPTIGANAPLIFLITLDKVASS
jgi:peptidylprolyl isomerase